MNKNSEIKFQGKYSSSVIDTLLQAYRPEKVRVLFLLIAGLIGRLSLLSNANLIGYWVDSITDHPVPIFLSALNTGQFVTGLMSLTLIGFIFTLTFRIGLSRLSARAVSRIYDETTLRTSRLPMSFFDQNSSGRVMTRFSSDYNNIFRIFGGPLAEFIGLIFDFIAMTLLIGFASPFLIPFWLIQALLNYGIYRFCVKNLRERRRESARLRSPSVAHFAESVNGVSTIMAYQRENIFTQRFSRLTVQYLNEKMRAVSAFSRFSFFMGLTSAFVFLTLGYFSIQWVKSGKVGMGSIGVGFTYIGLSTTILQSFFEWLGQFEEAMTGLERMNEYLRLPLEKGARLPAQAQFNTGHHHETVSIQPVPLAIGDGKGHGVSIELDQVSLRYGDDLPWVLKDINLTVSPGEKLAVIGKTGSGKTSLVQALFQLYPLSHGNIKIAGRSSDTLDLESYRGLISYINQEATLFMGTLRENLISDDVILSDGVLIQALKKVQFLAPQATDSEYLHWLDYVLEEKGRNLSLGERQLVCMTRCLLKNAPIVILDEATSSVDPESEQMMTRATELFFQGRTQLIIAHRLSSIRGCDRVLWLQNGQVHRLGPPSQVLPEFEKALLEV
jgi:ABC-type multidrug transport system fused ATPase/permease subunit